MVELETIATATAWVGAACSSEVGRRPEGEGGAKLGREVAAEVRHGQDAFAVRDNGLDEGVLDRLSRLLERHRATADDVAELPVVEVAAPVGLVVEDKYDLRPDGPVPSGAEQGDEGIGSQGSEGLRPSLVARLLGRRFLELRRHCLDSADQRLAGVGRHGAGEAGHTEVVGPRTKGPGLALALGQVGGINGAGQDLAYGVPKC